MKTSVFWGGLTLVVALLVGGYFLLSTQTAWEISGRQRFVPNGEFIDAGGGRKLRVWCQGLGNPGVVLEATGLGGADQYKDLIPDLARYTRVCAYDRGGMGYSYPFEKQPKFSDYVDDLRRVAKHTGPGPHVVVGASYGGLVALAYARTHADEVGGLVMLDAVVPEAFEAMSGPWSSLDSATRKAAWAAPFGLVRRADPLKLADNQEAWLIYRASTWTAVRQLTSTRDEAKTLLGTLPPLRKDLPLWVLRHTKVGDMMGPDFSMEESKALEPKWVAIQEAFAAQSTESKVIAVPNAGHLIAIDAQEETREAVVDVVRKAATALREKKPAVPTPTSLPVAPAPGG